MTSDDSDIAQLIELEEARCHATGLHDWDVLDQVLDEDFTYTHTQGHSEDRAEYLAGLSTRSLSIVRTEIQVRRYGDTAVMSGEGRFTLTLPSGEVRITQQVLLEAWVLRPNGWKLVALQGTRKEQV